MLCGGGVGGEDFAGCPPVFFKNKMMSAAQRGETELEVCLYWEEVQLTPLKNKVCPAKLVLEILRFSVCLWPSLILCQSSNPRFKRLARMQ